MWAMGCVMAEMYLLKPMFPGTSLLNQIWIIVDFTGKPSADVIEGIESEFKDNLLEGLSTRPSVVLNQLMPASCSSDALDLLQLLLQFSPDLRITSGEALEHPFVGSFHNPDNEPVYETHPKPLRLPLDDSLKLNTSNYRDQLYADILHLPHAIEHIHTLRAIREDSFENQTLADRQKAKKIENKYLDSNVGSPITSGIDF
jgi:serine/threonine protein kinase